MPRTDRILVACVTLLAACADSPSASIGPAPAGELARLTCTADVRAGSMDCRSASGEIGGRQALLGGQGTYVRMANGAISMNTSDHVFSTMVTVENLTVWPMGTPDSVAATGVRVFFLQEPRAVTVTTGTPDDYEVSVFTDSAGTFTAAGQKYFVYPGILAAGDVTEEQLWEFAVPEEVTRFSFQVAIAAELPVERAILRFGQHATAPVRAGGTFYADVWARDGHIFAVGEGGSIAHFDGVAWKDTVPVPSVNGLYAVHGSSPTNVYAVGAGGLILRWDGTTWQRDVQPDGSSGVDGQDVTAVFVLDHDNVFAAGTGRMYHRTSGAWSSRNDVPFNDISSILGRSATEVYALGSGFTYSYDGATWSRTLAGEGGHVLTLRGDSILKMASGSEQSFIYHRDLPASSTYWTPRSTAPVRLNDITMADRDNYYGVGNAGLLLHWNGLPDGEGGRWTVLRSGTGDWLFDVAAENRQRVVAVSALRVHEGIR